MEYIILTKNIKDGNKLRNTLVEMGPDLSSIQCYEKEDILRYPELFVDTSVIFSTWYMPEFTEQEIKFYFPQLRSIFYAAGTVKYFAEPFLRAGVKVYTASKANSVPVAEFVVAQIILANKGYFQACIAYKKPFWRLSFNKARSYTLQKTGNYDAKIGLIGCGCVGSEVVNLLKPYKLQIYVYDPFLTDCRIAQLGVRRAELSEIFSNCDVISNHLPDIKDTRGIIDYSLLSKMNNFATFINSGRGAQVVEKDIIKVLKQKPEICALLDVTAHEPLWPWSPLIRRKNAFISPHIAGSLSNEFSRLVQSMMIAHKDFKEGRPNLCEISSASLSTQA